jgi:hypothetical protein
MRFLPILTAAALAFSFGAPQPGLAAEPSPKAPIEQVQNAPKFIEPTVPVYKPRKGSALRGRVDGGFRGGDKGEPVVKVLAPGDHIGFTIRKAPALYWYLSQTTTYPIEFTLVDNRRYQPELQVSLKPPPCPGIQMVGLADYNKTLEEEVQYWWHIAVIVDPESRSKDIHSAGAIERIPYLDALVEGRTSCKDPLDVFCLYVESGLWYDAIQVISDLITGHPKDRVLRLMRASLLEQVGLNDVADYDRMQNGTPCPARKAEADTATASAQR